MTGARWAAAEELYDERGQLAGIGHNGGPGIEERAVPISLENAVSLNSPEVWGILSEGSPTRELPRVGIERALEVPAVFCAVRFLSTLLAALPLHAYRKNGDEEAKRIGGDLQMILNEAPNAEWSSFDARRYFWQQVFGPGRGMMWIERSGSGAPIGLWPMDPDLTAVRRKNGRKLYSFGGNEYPAADVIDVPFMLKRNQIDVYSPIHKCNRAIALLIAMEDFAAGFFQGGGVPPLSLEGPMPSGPDAFKRAKADIDRAIKQSRESNSPFFGVPPGHVLKAVGLDPAKGQMVEARLGQIGEVARIYGLAPIFLQDLSHGTFTNAEQQDIQLAKHTAAGWCKALEDEANLKLFGQRRRARYVEHALDALMRGDFLSRINAIARGIQTAQITPNEGRALENRPPKPEGDKLYIQGATVPLGTQPVMKAPKENGGDGNASDETKD